MQALPDTPESLAIVEMGGGDTQAMLFLNIGLEVCEIVNMVKMFAYIRSRSL